jgi:hypothetical protein
MYTFKHYHHNYKPLLAEFLLGCCHQHSPQHLWFSAGVSVVLPVTETTTPHPLWNSQEELKGHQGFQVVRPHHIPWTVHFNTNKVSAFLVARKHSSKCESQFVRFPITWTWYYMYYIFCWQVRTLWNCMNNYESLCLSLMCVCVCVCTRTHTRARACAHTDTVYNFNKFLSLWNALYGTFETSAESCSVTVYCWCHYHMSI